jgi:hypothetical protein
VAGQHYERPGVACGVLQGGVIRDVVQHHGCAQTPRVCTNQFIFFRSAKKFVCAIA